LLAYSGGLAIIRLNSALKNIDFICLEIFYNIDIQLRMQ